jgi:hypothetical protein
MMTAYLVVNVLLWVAVILGGWLVLSTRDRLGSRNRQFLALIVNLTIAVGMLMWSLGLLLFS